MFKITIDNEEVLCDKNFTINEEMLNTSSVVLNNVYPKTWEQDKDYVSRFYYPKDYSKCKIFNETYHPQTKEIAEGTNFSINVDTTKQYQVQTLKGQTTQSGTPTPSSPQPINVVSGRQVVSVSNGTTTNSFEINLGKNLLNLTNGTYSNNGITAEVENGKITLNGTASAVSFINIPYNITLEANQSYTLSANNNETIGGTGSQTYASIRLRMSTSDDTATDVLFNVQNNTRIITKTANTTYSYFRIRTGSGLTYNNFVIYPQLEKGNVATTYAPYKTPIYLGKIGNYQNFIRKGTGKNLFDKDNANIVNLLVNSALNFISSGNATTIYIPCKPNTTYTFKRYYYSTSDITLFTCENIPVVNGQATKRVQGTNNNAYSITTEANDNYIGAYIYFGTDTTARQNVIDNLQIEEGNQATLYEPYDYKDKWYIHKEIGRLDLISTSYNRLITNYSNVEYIEINKPTDFLGYNLYDTIEIKSNKATWMATTTGGWDNAQNIGKISGNANKPCWWMGFTKGTGTDNIKTQLNGCYIDYPLITPTNTLIEDEELINQLNSIELFEGINNVVVSSPYLPFIMTLMYNYQEEHTDEDILFCGVVENTGNISLNPRYPHYCNLQVLDFKTFLSEGETLDFVIYNKTILEAINQVIGTISEYGFILGNVNILHSDDVIGAYSTKDKTAYDVFNYLADITQSRWTTRMVDENTIAIDFYDPTLMPQGTEMIYSPTWFADNKIQDMSFSYSSRDYRNKQVMLSGEVYANIETTEIIVADGYKTQFNTTSKIGYVTSILLNGNPATMITKEEYELGYDGDFYYQPGNPYFESIDLVSTGSIITIVYFAIIQGREVLLNQDEITRVAEGINRKGVVARYENRNDATTTSELQMIGQSYLRYKGSPEILLKVETTKNIWNIGERVNFYAPLTELTTEYMVKKKTINYITTQDNIFYTFELSSNFNSETEINYFDNQRSKMMGNIGEGEYISRNIDIENTANVVFYGLEVQEVDLGANTLQSELQTTLGVE